MIRLRSHVLKFMLKATAELSFAPGWSHASTGPCVKVGAPWIGAFVRNVPLLKQDYFHPVEDWLDSRHVRKELPVSSLTRFALFPPLSILWIRTAVDCRAPSPLVASWTVSAVFPIETEPPFPKFKSQIAVKDNNAGKSAAVPPK